MNTFLFLRTQNWESTEDRHIQAPKSFIRGSRANSTRSGSQPLVSSPQITEERLHFSFWCQDYFIPLLGRGFWTYAVLKIVCHFYFRIMLWITKKTQKKPVWGLPYVTDTEPLRICVVLNPGGEVLKWNMKWCLHFWWENYILRTKFQFLWTIVYRNAKQAPSFSSAEDSGVVNIQKSGRSRRGAPCSPWGGVLLCLEASFEYLCWP